MKTTKPLPAHTHKQLRGGLASQLVTCRTTGEECKLHLIVRSFSYADSN
ncbi:hypothetical protein NC652_006103 [Populus alba x Populus x berolinensis]|uniref:Uncharacterized protein n=1 Tax=Populus alba x Populus x berolinensis TaxID=444605 RepID=A0AAD6RD66_9ROSI|nr:hypothetical protein NC652_006103 [Populus alba x Populus x berolinensis]KAJ7006823.1 hypothetical protein NC653_006009 [Populus alba x Populus x berolinensis]